MHGATPVRRRDLRLLILGQTTSQLGTQVSGVAVPLLALLTLHASPLQLGVVTASGTFAFALIGLPAGAWLDRWPRRPVLVASDLARAALLATIPIAARFGFLAIGQLIVVSLLVGAVRVFFDVGYQSYLPAVTGNDAVLAGNSAMETVRACGQIVGPGLGGWLVALIDPPNVVLIQAVTFALSAISLVAIRAPEPPKPAGPTRPRLTASVAEGLGFVARTPVLRATAMTSGAGNFAFAIGSAVTVVFMIRNLRLSPTAVGVVTALGSVSVMVGAALTPRLARRFGSARIIWLSLVATGPVALLGPLAWPGRGVSLLVVGTTALELGQIVYAITNTSMRQRLCPPELLGRVTATMRFLMMGLFPVGALLGGVLAEVVGVRLTCLLSISIVALSAVPVRRALRHDHTVEDLPAWRADPAR